MPEFTPFEVLVRHGIFGLSCFAGVWSLVLGIDHLRHFDRPWAWAYVCSHFGLALIVITIAEVVLPAPGVPYTRQVGQYLLGSFLVSVGMIGVFLDTRRKRRRLRNERRSDAR